MLPTNVVSFVKKMVTPNEADPGPGKATARLSKLKQTLTSGLQQAHESVNKLSPTRPFNAKLDLSVIHQTAGTESHRLLGKPSAPLSLPNLQQQGTETPVALTSSNIPSSTRKVTGPPDRATSCRVCVRSLSAGDVNHRLCTQCGLKVCDDCASYSSASQDEKEKNTWKCSICRRKNQDAARDLSADPTNLSRAGTPTQLTPKSILRPESNSGSLPRRHSEQTLPSGIVVQPTVVQPLVSQHRSSLGKSRLPATAETNGRNQTPSFADYPGEVYRSVTPALDNNLIASASPSSTARQRHQNLQRDHDAEEHSMDKSQGHVATAALLKPRRDSSLELDRHRTRTNVLENSSSSSRTKGFLQPTHHKVYAVRSVEDLRQASNWDRNQMQRRPCEDEDRSPRRKGTGAAEERFTATPSPRPVSSTSASASESSVEDAELQTVTESTDTWAFRRESQRRRARVQRQKSREAEVAEDRRRSARDNSNSPRHQLLVPLGSKAAGRRTRHGMDTTWAPSTNSCHHVCRRYSSESSDASSDIMAATEGMQHVLVGTPGMGDPDATGTAEEGPESLRSSFRRRSSFRASRSKQHRYDLDISDGYDADEQSIGTIDSSPSPASPEPPLSGMHFARRLTPGHTESLEDDACEGSSSRTPRSSSRLSLGANASDDESRRTRRRSSQWSEVRALPTPPLTPRNSFQLPKRDERSTSSTEQQHSLSRGNSNTAEGEAIRIVIHDVDSDRHTVSTSGSGHTVAKEQPKTRSLCLQKETVDLHNNGVRGFGLSVIGGKPNADGRLETWISRIRPDGPADRALLTKGQKIVRWNGITLTDRSFEEVQAIMERTSEMVDIEVEVSSEDMEEDGPSRYNSRRSAAAAAPSAHKASDSLNVSQDSEPEKSPPASPTRRRLPRTPSDLNVVEAAGRIQLRLWYSGDRGGQLVCTVIKAEDVRSRNQDGVICWARIHLVSPGGTKRTFSTESVGTSRTPCWDSIFTFSDLSESDLMDSVLEVSVWEEAVDREKVFLGEAVLQLGRMALEGRPIWYQLVDDIRRNGARSATPGDSRLTYAKECAWKRHRTLSDDNDNSLELNSYDTDSSNGGPLPKSTSADFNLLHPEQAWKSGASAPASLASSRRGSSHGSPVLTNLDPAQLDRLLPRSLPPSRRGSSASVRADSAELDSEPGSAEGLLSVGRKDPRRSLSFRMNRDGNWDKDAKLLRSASLRRGTEDDDEEHNDADKLNSRLKRIPGPASRLDAISLSLGPAQISPLHLTAFSGQMKLGIILTKGQMEVEVIGARNLPKGPVNMPPDTFVKLYIHNDDRVIAQRKTRIMRQTTSPQFNQAFSFDVRDLACSNLLVFLMQLATRPLATRRGKNFASVSSRTLGFVELALSRLPPSALTIAWYPIFAFSGDDHYSYVSDDEFL